VLLAAFLLVEARSRAPMLPLSLFRSSTFSGANLLTLFLYTALGGVLFFVPLNLIQVQKYNAAEAGAALLPFIGLMFVMSRWAGGLIRRYGAKKPLIVGPIIAGIGCALFARPSLGGSYWTTFFPAIAILGIGMAISVAPLTTTVMSAVSDDRAGVASGVNNAIARVAGLFAVAALGLVLSMTFNRSLDRRVANSELSSAARASVIAERSKLAGAEVSDAQARRMIDDAFVDGFRVVVLIAAGLAFAAAVSAAVLIDRPSITERPLRS